MGIICSTHEMKWKARRKETTISVLLYDVAIRADHKKNIVLSGLPIGYVARVTCFIVAPLFIMPLPSNVPWLSANLSQ